MYKFAFFVFFASLTLLKRRNSIIRERNKFLFERFFNFKRFRFFNDFIIISVIFFVSPKFRVENVNFFDSKYQKKNFFTYINVDNAKKHVFYKNVYVFIERLKNLIKQHDDEIIENFVATGFRNFVLM